MPDDAKQNGIKRPELLSPAGDLEGVKAAITAGADAVYLGASLFSARAYAKNLTDEELLEAIDFAHLFGRKIYLACNILLRDAELPQALKMIAPLYERGLDGIIVQDLGLLRSLHECFPGLPLHASTQMAVLSAAGAEWLTQYGVSRVVPGRELLLAEIGAIVKSGIEVECFVHGAMCYSYSGRCLFSSMAGGRSGNRGRCAGPCRQRYLDENGKAGYFLSMKDMCALERIGELIDLGVASFKIEGRMKATEYTAGVTAVYRKYIDAYLEKGKIAVTPEDRKTLSSLYIRSERQEGYLAKHNGAEMVSVDSPAYTETPDSLKAGIRERYIDHTLRYSVSMHCYAYAGTPLFLSIECIDGYVEKSGTEVSAAQKRATTESEIEKQLIKTGDTFFELGRCTVGTDGASFVPVAEVNRLRREGLKELEEQILAKGRRKAVSLPEQLSDTTDRVGTAEGNGFPKRPRILVGVKRTEQVEAALENDMADGIILPLSLYGEEAEKEARSSGKQLYLRMPEILRQKDCASVEKQLKAICTSGASEQIGGIYCGSLDALALASKFFPRERIIAEESLYVWNRRSTELILKHAGRYTASDERNGHELAHAIRRDAMELVLYGYRPLMYSANCLQKTVSGCDPKAGVRKLRDEKGHTFYALPEHRYCYNTLYNCVPLSLHKQLPEIVEKKMAGTLRLEFTMENKSEMRKILDSYRAIMGGDDGNVLPADAYTTGHFRRGAE